MKKTFLLITLVIILSGSLLLMNIFMGNPISKMKAQRETIEYYENAYKEKFIVYNSEYNPLIPAYIFGLGPVNNKNIKFDTGLFCQEISDEYGGMLASLKISEDIGSILQKEYGYLKYEISAEEDPLASYAGESPDYFQTNPKLRVLKNHYNVVISLPDGIISETELREIAPGMVKKIETKLPYQTPNLRVYIKFKSQKLQGESDTKVGGAKFFELFSTTK